MSKLLAGKLNIGKVTCNDREDYVRIVVVDKTSRVEVVEIQASLEEFAQALFSFADRSCTYGFGNSALFGLRREHKTEVVKVPVRSRILTSTEEIRKAVAAFEVDGWEGRDEDAQNSHKIVSNANDHYLAKVAFTRYVRPEGQG